MHNRKRSVQLLCPLYPGYFTLPWHRAVAPPLPCGQLFGCGVESCEESQSLHNEKKLFMINKRSWATNRRMFLFWSDVICKYKSCDGIGVWMERVPLLWRLWAQCPSQDTLLRLTVNITLRRHVWPSHQVWTPALAATAQDEILSHELFARFKVFKWCSIYSYFST